MLPSRRANSNRVTPDNPHRKAVLRELKFASRYPSYALTYGRTAVEMEITLLFDDGRTTYETDHVPVVFWCSESASLLWFNPKRIVFSGYEGVAQHARLYHPDLDPTLTVMVPLEPTPYIYPQQSFSFEPGSLLCDGKDLRLLHLEPYLSEYTIDEELDLSDA